ncbi:EAL domain-containing response regulator [Vibrio ulleungensis]|uniref:EAL domain-containing response regulator n=1 Tax=Vibrio ulleungensis TaxID=2807619 RepID=A0ABS2HHJ5_9VIBR|nr:EAL domain-containing response regulator [Vibrio ulleungensis]MBM7035564.1 EAL domain-containing response regulator [Vibrio ulleungensis]
MNEHASIVIVDDNLLQLTLLERTLKRKGASTVHGFVSGYDALSWMAQHHADILFCDLKMPEIDGIDMLIALDKQGFTGNVVILSAMEQSVTATVRAMCDNFGFNVIGQLTKPYEQQQLDSFLALPTQILQTPQKADNVIVSEADLLIALAEGQIQNFYQPLVDFDSNIIVGVEALARWHHPQFGVLSPAVFMPIIERCNLSLELFDTVFGNAITDIQEGQLAYQVSLNVEHSNLQFARFSDEFLARCLEHDIAPSKFTIEITEGDSYHDSVELFRNLSKLRLNGVGVSIDDFGTGFSSLQKLSALPFNEIKIDRSFVQGLINEPKKNQIVYFICALAKSLDINVVAEGVEDKATWNTLKNYGVNVCQGFYRYRPMPIQDLALIP